MAIYVGVNGGIKNISAVYIGIDGVPKEVSEICAGYNNAPKCIYASTVDLGKLNYAQNEQFIYTNSGFYKSDDRSVKGLQVFCVGGGGNSGTGDFSPGNHGWHWSTCAGGGGGYTNTATIEYKYGDSVPISIGSAGGTTSAGSVSANGGNGAAMREMDGGCYVNSPGSGGSGGGFAEAFGYLDDGIWNITEDGSAGGSDGSSTNTNQHYSASTFYGGVKDIPLSCAGQGHTTRAFGESNGTLYAGGGGGHGCAGGAGGGGSTGPGTPGTGGGGGGGNSKPAEYSACTIFSGGSGIAIIRPGRR